MREVTIKLTCDICREVIPKEHSDYFIRDVVLCTRDYSGKPPTGKIIPIEVSHADICEKCAEKIYIKIKKTIRKIESEGE